MDAFSEYWVQTCIFVYLQTTNKTRSSSAAIRFLHSYFMKSAQQGHLGGDHDVFFTSATDPITR